MEGPSFVIGNIAKGKDLWDRDYEISTIQHALGNSSVLLKAPRRFGKSSIMYKLYENSGSDCKAFFENTEGTRDPQDFIARLMVMMLQDQHFRNNVKKWFKKHFPKIEEVGFSAAKFDEINIADFRLKIRDGIGSAWQDKGLELISKIKDYEGKLLFILDELPLLVQKIMHKEGKPTAYEFLHWFRSIRQMPELSHVRWLVGGSIGIEHILDQIGTGTKVINDFQILRVEAFTDTEGRAYIKALLRNEGQMKKVQNKIIDELIDTIGAPVPYFIQILVYECLNEMRRQKKRTLSSEIIKSAYKEGVLGPASRTYFEHYFSRLKDYYDPDLELTAKRLILEVARQGAVNKTSLFKLFRLESKGKLSDETFSHLMSDIENDFYVSYNTELKSYSFTTNVLRDWWLRYYDLVEE